jgi:hypothetical protein
MYDLITEYFPDIEELTSAQLAEARGLVVDYLQPHFPFQDMAPGSVFGDSYVSPAATFFAALTVSQNRFMSDLDLENVANGIVYSCTFVERYLGNFAVRDVTTLQSSGLVRLTFSADIPYTVNKGVKFSFGGADVFYPRLPSMATDSFRILPSGSVPNTALNEVALSQTSLTTWAVDLPLTGKMSATVARGAGGLASTVQAELIGIAAAVEFEYGLPPVSLPALAEIARRTAYAASVGSRNSTRAFVTSQWPETKVVSVVLSGDAEMQRSVPGTSLALAAPAVDVFFRSKRDYQQESQSVRLSYVPTLRAFRGKVSFLHRPSMIESVAPTADLDLPMASVQIYSQVKEPRFPGSTGCGTTLEEFWIHVVPPVAANNVILVNRSSDEEGQFAMFTVTYRADPLFEPVSAMLTSPDNAPVGLDLAVKAGPLIRVNLLKVGYRRKPGTTMALDTARTEIAAYVNGVGWPDLFSEAPIVESMYAAGALRTQAVNYEAVLSVTAANARFAPSFVPTLYNDWDAIGNVALPPTYDITAAADMRPDILVSGNSNEVAELYAISDRNVRYYLAPENIVFQEHQ